MALIEIEYGSLASSGIMNQNFEYLDNRISSVSESISAYNAGINSNIASLNGTISNLSDEFGSDITELNTNFNTKITSLANNGLYITTYTNGASWYREYFSDSEKTQRVWLEQGGSGRTQSTISLLKSFSSSHYFVSAQRTSDTYEYAIIIENINSRSFYADCRAYGNATRTCNMLWYACGK